MSDTWTCRQCGEEGIPYPEEGARNTHRCSSDPAFPYPTRDFLGMSLRDWFAGQALVGLMSNWFREANMGGEDIAGLAYGVADDMLAERAKREDE